ncbi:phage structure protein [Helicobacter phage 1961P]|uniref:Phage structure protein n=1 Tax=Helicobacter phage 1961P TaxID=1154995 RepID=I6NVW0_9CAUD|nr:phage structure protein [Helicobacter phage 1961P]AFC61917.1 phage structure protein [Helicobacter phage 1961P]
MKQRVKTVSYLAKAEFEFKAGVYDLVALPAGAEVVKVSLEVVGNLPADLVGNFGIGFRDEDKKDFFLTLSSISNGLCITNTKDYTAVSNRVIVAEVKGEKLISSGENNIKGVVRVLYFLPSETEVEY